MNTAGARASITHAPDSDADVEVIASVIRPSSLEVRRQRVAQSLSVGNLGNNARALAMLPEGGQDAQIELDVDEIRPYEHNPRRDSNARFAEIRESIRVSGVRNPITVTRRPGESHFIVEAGGNTRLLAIRQLWAETGEERFRRLAVVVRSWRSETHVLSAHLIENEQRGDMTFRDRAAGMATLKAQLEAEQGRTLSLRQLEQALAALGMAISTATLSQCLFATTRLGTLCEALPQLSGNDVKVLQPRLNLMRRYAQLHSGLPEDSLYRDVFEPVFREAGAACRRRGAFHAGMLLAACEAALAGHLEETVERLRGSLQMLSGTPHATLHDLQAALPSDTDRPQVPATETGHEAHAGRLQALRTGLARFAAIAIVDARFDPVVLSDRLCATRHVYPDPIHESNAVFLSHALRMLEMLGGGDETPRTTEPPTVGDAAFARWLVNPEDAVSAAFWDVLRLVRELNAVRPGANDTTGRDA